MKHLRTPRTHNRESSGGLTSFINKIPGMNTERLILGVFVIATTALIVLSVVFYFNSQGTPKSKVPGLTTSPRVNITPYPTIPPITDMSVMINSRRFNPKTVTINHGNHVGFQNISDTPMTLEAGDANSKMLNIGPIGSGDEMILKFDQPGVYTYKNAANPKETGTVIIK